MHGEDEFAEVGGRFKVGEDVGEEMRWVGVGREALGGGRGAAEEVVGFGYGGWVVGVGVMAGLGCVFVVVEDYDFVDAEDGEGAGEGACEEGFLVDGLRTKDRSVDGRNLSEGRLLCYDAARDSNAQSMRSPSRRREHGGWFGGVRVILGRGVGLVGGFSFLAMLAVQ